MSSDSSGFQFRLYDGTTDVSFNPTRGFLESINVLSWEKNTSDLSLNNFDKDVPRGSYSSLEINGARISQQCVEEEGGMYYLQRIEPGNGDKIENKVKAPTNRDKDEHVIHRKFILPWLIEQIHAARPKKPGLSPKNDEEKRNEAERFLSVLYCDQHMNQPLGILRKFYGYCTAPISSEVCQHCSYIPLTEAPPTWTLGEFLFDDCGSLSGFTGESVSDGKLLFYKGAEPLRVEGDDLDFFYSPDFDSYVKALMPVSQRSQIKVQWDHQSNKVRLVGGSVDLFIDSSDFVLCEVFTKVAISVLQEPAEDDRAQLGDRIQQCVQENKQRLIDHASTKWDSSERISFFSCLRAETLQSRIKAELKNYKTSSTKEQKKVVELCRAYIAKNRNDAFTRSCRAAFELFKLDLLDKELCCRLLDAFFTKESDLDNTADLPCILIDGPSQKTIENTGDKPEDSQRWVVQRIEDASWSQYPVSTGTKPSDEDNRWIYERAAALVLASALKVAIEMNNKVIKEIPPISLSNGMRILRHLHEPKITQTFSYTFNDRGELSACEVTVCLSGSLKYRLAGKGSVTEIGEEQWSQQTRVQIQPDDLYFTKVETTVTCSEELERSFFMSEKKARDALKKHTEQTIKTLINQDPVSYERIDALCVQFIDEKSKDDPLYKSCVAARKMIAYVLSPDVSQNKKEGYKERLKDLFSGESAQEGQTHCLAKLKEDAFITRMHKRRNDPWQIALVVVLWCIALLPGIIATVLFHCLQWSRLTKGLQIKDQVLGILSPSEVKPSASGPVLN